MAQAITELPLDALSAGLFGCILHQICGMHARRPWKGVPKVPHRLQEVLLAFSLVAVGSPGQSTMIIHLNGQRHPVSPIRK